jgi:hypothetical protein
MRCVALLCLALLAASCSTTGQNPANVDPSGLIGRWKVDLRPTPTAPEYFQEFVISEVSGKTFIGAFYGTPITQGRINADWGAVYFAFETADNSGPYHHSGVLRGNRMEGLTNSAGRNFLSYWTATRQ